MEITLPEHLRYGFSLPSTIEEWLKEYRNVDCVLLWDKNDPKPAYIYWTHRLFFICSARLAKS